MKKKIIGLWVYLISLIFVVLFFNVTNATATDLGSHFLTVGETWDLGGGYTLTANSIDVASKKTELTLSKDGTKVENKILYEGQTFVVYKLFYTKVNSIFAGATSDMVKLTETTLTIAKPISYTLSSPNPSTVYAGETFTASVSIQNDDLLYSGRCKVEVYEKWSDEYAVEPGATITIPLPSLITAPSTASANFFVTVTTYCHSTNDPTDVLKYININFQAIASPEMIAQQTAEADKNSAYDAKFSAKKVIFSINASLKEAQDAINDAKNIGADVNTAHIFLDTAISKLNSANTKLSEAESYFAASKWSDAKSSATQAEYYANDALTNAGNAKSVAIQSKEKYSSATPTSTVTSQPKVTAQPSVVVGDFAVSISPTTITVNPGDTMKFKLAVMPSGGFSEPVEIYVKIKALGQEKDLGRVTTFYPPYEPFVFENPVPDEIPKGTTIYGYITAKGGGLERNADTVTVKVPGFRILLIIAAIGMAMFLIKRKERMD